MRVLHLIPLHVPSSGIVAQAQAEQRAAKEANLPWQVRIFTHGVLPVEAESLRVGRTPADELAWGSWLSYAYDKSRHRMDLYRWLRRHHFDFDMILLRHTYADPARARALGKITTPILSVHHTLEIPELSLERDLQGKIRVALERTNGPKNIRASAGIIGVTKEILHYEQERAGRSMPGLVFPNGLDFSTRPLFADQRGAIPEMLFVASEFAPWHGLDRLLDSIEASRREFVLHLVGHVHTADRERAMSDSRIRLHGMRSSDEIAKLAARSTLGLSSFALDRNGMSEACTLKVREYLSSGLATYAGHHDVFPPDSLIYRRGPADVDALLGYANEVAGLSRARVRELSEAYVSKRYLLEKCYRGLHELGLQRSG